MNEELTKVDIQKQIIERIVNHLSSLGSDMYYESTMNICHEIKNVIKDGKLLNKTDTELVKNLNPKDIQSLLSYNSNCC